VTNAGGVVLCGGESRRMGRPKAWLPVGNEVLLQRVVRVVGEVMRPVVIVAATEQDVPPLPERVELVRDETPGLGPLGGLATGLAALRGRADVVFLSACDMPRLTPAFVRQVLDGLADADIAVPDIGGRLHPLAGVYRITVLPVVRSLLAQNRLRMTDLLAAVSTRTLDASHFTDPSAVSNVNTPEEYAELLRSTEPIV
jgi:molybdenum cofactor guanylyltransferase